MTLPKEIPEALQAVINAELARRRVLAPNATVCDFRGTSYIDADGMLAFHLKFFMTDGTTFDLTERFYMEDVLREQIEAFERAQLH